MSPLKLGPYLQAAMVIGQESDSENEMAILGLRVVLIYV